MRRSSRLLRRFGVEVLEPRVVLSLTFGFDPLEVAGHHRPGHAGGPGGNDPEPPPETGIDLPTVLAHEIGHALGLRHSTSPDCGAAGQPLMCAFYLGPAFSLQQEDINRINGLYPESGTPDTTNTQGRWDSTALTYSFMPEATELEQQRVVGGGPPRLEPDLNSLYSTLDAIFGAGNWQSIFSDALDLWTQASKADGMTTVLTFSEVSDGGASFDNGTDGPTQGQIRFGAHGFDGEEGTLAHGYFAPPNGNTAAGDIHLDEAEHWQDLRDAPLSTTTSAHRRGLAHAQTILPSHPQIVAASFVAGHDGDESGPLNVMPPSRPGQQIPDKEDSSSTADRQTGQLPPNDSSVRVEPSYRYQVDSTFAGVGRIHSAVSRPATEPDFESTADEDPNFSQLNSDR